MDDLTAEKEVTIKETTIAKSPGIQRLYIVGIGASAGGLEALRELVRKLDYNPRLTYVIAQHLSPTHTSMLKTLLARECILNVEEVRDKQIPEANTIYITPPDSDIIIQHGVLRLVAPKPGVGPKPSVNRFFSSLAEDQEEYAIGIILSGTGGDGASGLLSLKSAGGTTFVQDPATAKYDGMPQTAIQCNSVDLILPPKKMADALSSFVLAGALIPESIKNETSDYYDNIIQATRDITGFNLSQYKSSTITRRIKRRMALYHFQEMKDYHDYLKDHHEEAENFAKDVLISVTEFFRDTEAFDSLRSIIGDLVERSSPQQTFRTWVPGCATGEEAYSIAILFEEAMRVRGVSRNYQVFASDIDANAAQRGRSGRYSSAAFEKMDPELRNRYFQSEGGDYIAIKSLRDHIVFSVHNLIQDPPFSRVDLVSCRNLLIYFTTPLQKRVMEVFHYALNPNGVLFLGKSETVSQHEDLYSAIDKPKRLYRKVGDRRIYRPYSLPADIQEDFGLSRKNTSRPTVDAMSTIMGQAIQAAYGPPSVVISPSDEVIHSAGDIAKFLTFHAGPTGLSIYELVNASLRAELRALVYKSRRELSPEYSGRNTVTLANGETVNIRIAVRPISTDKAALLLVSFEDVGESFGAILPPDQIDKFRDNPVIIELEHELATTKEHLQTVVEELETSNEELQSLNEELQSANEELQSTNEELQTSNEELQSTNEELLTVNDETQVKTLELEILSSDLQNIQDSIDFPLIVVDKALRIVRFVPAMDQLIPIKDIHKGDVITSLPWPEEILRLRHTTNRVLRSGKAFEQLITINNQIYQMRIIPTLNKAREIEGVVLLFPNVTELETAKIELLQSEARLQNIIDTIVDGVITISARGKILSFSKAAQSIFGYKPKEIIGKNIKLLMPEDEAFKHDGHLNNYLETGVAKALGTQRKVFGRAKDGRIFPVELSVVESYEFGQRIFTGLVRDITAREKIEDDFFQEKERALVTLHSIADGVITTDRDGRVEYINAIAEQLTGWTNEEARNEPIGKVFKIIDEYTREPKSNAVQVVLDKMNVVRDVDGTILRSKDGREFAIEHNAAPIFNKGQELAGVIVVLRDITEKNQIIKQMSWQARHDPLTGLINRREMESRIESVITGAKSFKRSHALLYIDLDQFKVVNDTCGHQAGDELLRQIATNLSANVRHRDTLSRLGGDEFALLLENCSIGQAKQIAETIKENIEEFRFIWEEKIFKIGASIGVVEITEDSTDMTQVLSDADTACYGAKDGGRNRVKIHTKDDDVLAKQKRDMNWVSNINQVLDENRFVLYFQRIESLSKGKTSHWEALLRMHDDIKNEIVMPGVFLPAAERYGLMHNIDRWVLRSALTILSRVPESAIELEPCVSVNISGTSLGDDRFLDYVSEQFDAFSIKPSQICFEITETAAIANFVKAKLFISTMKKLGCRFALDDFGSGMSSFGYLKNLPVDFIKIDGSFVRSINRDVVDLAMVESINRIGHLMNIETVAEFAESEEILEKLKLVGVGYAQGYAIQRPIPTEEFLVTV